MPNFINPNQQKYTEAVRAWIAGYERRKQLEEELEIVKSQMADDEQRVKDLFLQEGLTRVNVDGMTVSIRRDIRVSVKDGDTDAATQALIDAGLSDLLKQSYNTNSLKAVIKELEEGAETGDENAKKSLAHLSTAFNVYEQFSLSARRGAQSKSGDRFLRAGVDTPVEL